MHEKLRSYTQKLVPENCPFLIVKVVNIFTNSVPVSYYYYSLKVQKTQNSWYFQQFYDEYQVKSIFLQEYSLLREINIFCFCQKIFGIFKTQIQNTEEEYLNLCALCKIYARFIKVQFKIEIQSLKHFFCYTKKKHSNKELKKTFLPSKILSYFNKTTICIQIKKFVYINFHSYCYNSNSI